MRGTEVFLLVGGKSACFMTLPQYNLTNSFSVTLHMEGTDRFIFSLTVYPSAVMVSSLLNLTKR